MASNPKDPMSKFFVKDIASHRRSNFNWSYKNRISADFGYLYPVGLWDVPADTHFELDLFASLSSNPTLAPILGKLKFRVEAYFVEKAAYVPLLRNNDRIPIDRNVDYPYLDFYNKYSQGFFVPKSSLLEMLQILPSGHTYRMFNGSSPQDCLPFLNGIPFLMYYDIYRNYYINPQDDSIPFRRSNFVPGVRDDQGSWQIEPIPVEDVYFTREDFDMFIYDCRDTLNVLESFDNCFGSQFLFGRFQSNVIGPPSSDSIRQHQRKGLLRRTLNNDFFTSFVSNSNVEIMKNHSLISVRNNVIDVEQISLANRNWRVATRNALWGTDWKDYNKVHYGVNLLIPYGKPQFLGALSSDVTFNDVISQAQTGNQDSSITSNTNLGSRAGIAFGGLQNGKGRFVEFNTKDEGYVMVLASIVPEVDYYQGIDPMYFKTNLMHSWMVEYNSVGMQDFHRSWATAIVPANRTESFESYNIAEWKVPIWFEYMAKYNQLHGDFTDDNYLRYWTFARPFNNLNDLFEPGTFVNVDDQYDELPYLSTYVLPEMFNYVFANNIGVDNFQLQFRFDCKASMMLDKQVIAYL